jgi:crotonobetainyl-CoA:carnitine CoA-transferase CaiB-like acyl-CoA transferase
VRVIAFSQFGAGPYATMNLADLGAEVIKVEDPSTGGDISRSVPPYRGDNDSVYFQAFNRNKRCLTLNLRKPEARPILHGLVRTADVVFNNLRGGQPAKLGLTYESLGAVNPKIVCCSLNAFGSEGPHADDPGYDYLMQALTGYMSLTGDPAGDPASCGVSVIDHAAGLAAAFGVVSAVLAASRTGFGRDLEVSLLDTAYSMLSYLAAWNLKHGHEPQRLQGSAHQSLVPVATYQTADGHITIFCGKQKFWALLCEAFEDPAMASDPKVATIDDRLQNRDQVTAQVQDHFLRNSTAHWIARLQGKVPCAPVRNLTEALADPDLESRGTVVKLDHPEFGELRQVNTPVRLNGVSRKPRRAPALGEDTRRLLKEYLQYSDETIDSLARNGVI